MRASAAVRVPVTGAIGANAEVYGAVTISRVELAAGGEITLPLANVNNDGGAGADGGGDSGSGGVTTRARGEANASGTSTNGGCSCGLAPRRRGDLGSGLLVLAAVAVLLAGSLRSRRQGSWPRAIPVRLPAIGMSVSLPVPSRFARPSGPFDPEV